MKHCGLFTYLFIYLSIFIFPLCLCKKFRLKKHFVPGEETDTVCDGPLFL